MPRIPSLLALPLLAAASLTAAGSAETDSFLRTEPHELIAGNAGDPWCEEGDAASTLAEPADLRGAHFAFSLECLFKAPKVPEDLAASIPVLEQVPAAQNGAEFLFVQVALSGEYSPEYTTEPSELTSWIESGKERIPIVAAPRSNDFYVVSVPRGDRAVLWVSDSHRHQGIDLRTGEQVDPVTAYYNGLALRSFDFGGYDTEEVDLRNGRYSGWIRCKTEYAEATTRAVWHQQQGWADEGMVFLEVRTNWCAQTESFTWELDQTKAFTIDGGGPVSWTATDAESTEGWDTLSLLFVIPADTVEATIDFSPVGTIEIRENGVELFTTKLPNFAWEAAF